MDSCSADGGGGDTVCLVQTPPTSQSMVEREIIRVVQALEELGTTPLVDTRQITLVDLSVSSTESEGDADRMLRGALFASPGQPTTKKLPAVCDSEEWLISLASPAQTPRAKVDVAPTSTGWDSEVQKAVADKDVVALLDLPASEETEGDTAERPALVGANGDSFHVAMPYSPHATIREIVASDEEATVADLSRASEDGVAVVAADTTFAIPALSPNLMEATSGGAAADRTMTLEQAAIPHRPAVQSDSMQESAAICEEAALMGLSCASEEGSAVALADTTFAIPAIPVAPATAAVPQKVTSVMGDTAVKPVQGAILPPALDCPPTAAQELETVCEEAAPVDSPSASEEVLAVAAAETTFAVPVVPAAPPTIAVPRKTTTSTGRGAADIKGNLGKGAIPRRPTGQQSLARRSMLPPPSQRTGQPSTASRLTVGCGRTSVGPAAADTTFGVTALKGRLPAPTSGLRPSQRPAAPAALKPATVARPGPPRVSSLRRSVVGTSAGATAASRSLQAPEAGASTSGIAKRGPASRVSTVPETTAAARTLVKPPTRPVGTGLRKPAAPTQKASTSAGQPSSLLRKQASEPKAQPQPIPKAAMQSQLPRSRLQPPRSRASVGLPRPTAPSGAASLRALPVLRPILDCPEPSRLSSTPVRSDAPFCRDPDLTPIRKQ